MKPFAAILGLFVVAHPAIAGYTLNSVSTSPIALDAVNTSGTAVLSNWSTPDGAFETSILNMSTVVDGESLAFHVDWSYDARLFIGGTTFFRSLLVSQVVGITVADSFDMGNGLSISGPSSFLNATVDGPLGRVWFPTSQPLILDPGDYWVSFNFGWALADDRIENQPTWIDYSWRASFDYSNAMPSPGALAMLAVVPLLSRRRR